MKATQRIEELADRFPRSLEQVLADSEEQIRGQGKLERYSALRDLSEQALDAGALDKASSYAAELLQLGNESKDALVFGSGIYDGNMMLGRVALRRGSVGEASRYLLESAKAPAPQLDSALGLDITEPDFTLARELLEKGERDTVLEFLTLCKGFWKAGADRLDAMAAEVRKGGTF